MPSEAFVSHSFPLEPREEPSVSSCSEQTTMGESLASKSSRPATIADLLPQSRSPGHGGSSSILLSPLARPSAVAQDKRSSQTAVDKDDKSSAPTGSAATGPAQPTARWCARLWPKDGLLTAVRRQRRGLALTACVGAMIVAVVCVVAFAHTYMIHLFLAAQQASPVLCVAIFMALYAVVSWPFAWGFSIVNAAGGYLFGVVGGVAVSSVGSCLGVVIVHAAIRRLFAARFEKFVRRQAYLHKVSRLLSSSDEAYKFVLLSRLTPIPFGLQNVVFTVSSIDTRTYLISSTVGLIPIQTLYCYLGSTLRSMEEVFSGGGNATAKVIFFGQLALGAVVMYAIVTKARAEMAKAISQNEKKSEESAESQETTGGAPQGTVHIV